MRDEVLVDWNASCATRCCESKRQIEDHRSEVKHGKLARRGLAAIALVLCAEVAIRTWALYWRTPYESYDREARTPILVPGVYETTHGRVEINPAGLVGASILPSEPGKIRILALGDSCTFGAGNRRNTYPSRLRTIIDERDPNGGRVEVLNAGLSGLDSANGLRRLMTLSEELQPSIVLVYLGWNDLMKRSPRSQTDTGRKARVSRWFDDLWTVRSMRKLAFYYIRPLISEPSTGPASRTGRFTSFEPSHFSSNLRAIVDAARQAGAVPVLLTLPTVLHESMHTYDLDRAGLVFPYFVGGAKLGDFVDLVESYNRTIRAIAEEEAVLLVDLARGFPAAEARRHYFLDGIHPNNEGMTLIASHDGTGPCACRSPRSGCPFGPGIEVDEPMCGIAGIASLASEPAIDQAELESMVAALRHRGPDAEGVWNDRWVGLAHTRLSIIDLADRSRQPMSSECGRYALSYNGEIYNYTSIRRELENGGCRFRTSSDTEVLLRLMMRDGAQAIDRLEGMFAFAFYDAEVGSLLIARDRVGIKPLFWAEDGEKFWFASEPKALPSRLRGRLPDAKTVAEYLTFRHLANRESLTPGVHSLAPGHLIEIKNAKVEIRRWWTATPGPESDPDAVMDIIRDSVHDQLVSDVPIGVFLSGGVDSSLVAAAAVESHPALNTFTVGFADDAWDESDRAKIVSDELATNAHVVQIEPDRYAEDLGRAIWHLDSPLNHAHSVHLLELSHQARKVVKVAITGEGGDELYAGYPRYRLLLAARFLRPLPAPLLRAGSRLFRHRASRVARLLDAASSDPAQAAALNSAFVSLPEAAALAGLDQPSAASGPRREIAQRALDRGESGPEALLALERETYLVSLLQRMDRMSMAVGLECRVPLLDNRMLAHSLALPISDRLTVFDSKKPLRQAAARRFGRAYANAPKFGFGVPLEDWFRQDGRMGLGLERVLRDRRTRERGLVDTDLALKLWREHRSGERSRTEELWGLLNLELWARLAYDGEDFRDVLPTT